LASKQTPNGNLNYTYDENGSIKTLRSNHANGVSVDYSYDDLSRLSTVKDNRLSGSQNTTYSYDAVGNLQSYTYPNTVTTSYAYNNLNRLTALSVANGQTNLASYAYTLGASGNRTSVTENTGRTVNYAYDDLYRLTSETIANSANNGQISYQFDTVGNRLQRTSSVNLVASQSSSYDANDRLTSDVFDNNGSTKVSNGKTYNYDFENHLTSTNDGITVVYDGDGNRVSKTVNGLTTKYLVDTNNLTGYAQVVEELQNNLVLKQYTYGLDLISQRQSGGVSFYNYDGHGSVRGLSNNFGNVTDTYTYDAFGTLIERTGSTDNSYLYAGEQFDADLGFYYNRARYLNVSTGRFISQDSYEGNSSEPKSLHKYTYAENDAENNSDPSGNFSIAENIQVAATVGILASIATVSVGLISSGLSGLLIPNGGFSKPSDGTVLSFQLNFSVGRLFKPTNPLGVALRVGFAGLGGIFNVDIVFPNDRPGEAWLYFAAGLSAGFGQVRDKGFGLGGSVGLVWNTKKPSDYAGFYFCSSVSISSIPEFGGRAIQGCGSFGGSYSATIGITQPPKPVGQGSTSYYVYLGDIGGIVQPVRGSISSAISSWEEIAKSLELE
jgi:RHS repeat-associated protein